MNSCWTCTPGCWAICILCAIGWLLIASGLLLLSWNKVVAAIANVKKAKFWQALLIVLTLVILCGPFCCGRQACRDKLGRCDQGGKNCCGECMPKAKSCGGCVDWKMSCDSLGHSAK